MTIRLAIYLWIIILPLCAKSQSITLSPNQTANQLATKLIGKGILLPGTGMTLNCHAQANGSFVNVNPTPNLSLAIDTGIVLCTGRVLTVSGDTGINANRAAQASKNWGISSSDAQITSIAGTVPAQHDLCFLQFHFIPQGDTAYIDYVFASEDYPEYGCSQYVDAFGIFVSPPSSTAFTNYAKVPGTTINVSINSINDTMKQTGAANYANYCQSLGSGAPFIQHYTGNLINNHIVYDGMTKILRATIPVSPYQTHTMKIAIADITDGLFDSGIFLKQASFTSKTKLEITEKRGSNGNTTNDTVHLTESCNSGLIRFSRAFTSSPITVNVAFSGTASASDYTAASSFTMPTGTSVFNYSIQAILDGLSETPENLRLVFSVPAINYYDTVQVLIHDFARGVQIFNGKRDTAICEGRAINLSSSAIPAGYTTSWLPPTRLSCIACANPTYTAPTGSGFLNDTIRFRIQTPGCPVADTPIVIRVHPIPILSANPNIVYCQGGSATLNVNPFPSSPNYSYLWSPSTALSSTTIKNPLANPTSTQTYKVVVSTSAGCKDSITQTVRVSTIRAEIDSFVAGHASCGTNNGSIRVVPKSGTTANPPYTYSINGGANFVSTNTFTALTAGTYNVAVKNIAGCRFDTTISIGTGIAVPAAVLKIDSTTCGLTNGKARIITKTGLKPVTQTWKQGSTTISADTFISNLASGVYTLTLLDSVGCAVNYTIHIGSSLAANANFNFIQASCGMSNGAITATPSSGIGPFRHLWNTGDTANMISSKPSGVYIHTLTDVKGCIKRDTVTLTGSQGIAVSKSFNIASCGLASGAAMVQITTGGTVPFTYLWSNSTTRINKASNGDTISGLTTGWYKLTIQDALGCLKLDSIFVNGTPQVSLNIVRTNANCGLANGSITVNVSSGKSPYTYNWSIGSANTNNRSGIAAGFYAVTVTDSNNCSVAAGITLVNNSLPIIQTQLVRPTCGMSNGKINTTISGAKPKVKFLWSTGDTSATLSKLPPGPYALTVTDSFGCQVVKRDTLIAIVPTGFTDSVIHPLCRGHLGAIYLKNIVGTPPFTFLWSDTSTNPFLLNKPSGQYSVLVRDSNNCRATRIIKINSTSKLQFKLAKNHAICRDTLGDIITTIDSGIGPFRYQWSTGDTTIHITNKNPGIYKLVVTDSFGCKDSMTDSIRRMPPPIYSDSFKKAKCDLANGSIDIYDHKGSVPFNFMWSHSVDAITPSLNSLYKGIYIVTITDNNNCAVTDTFDLMSKGRIVVNHSVLGSQCRDSTGKITLTILNGTPPYTINWSNGDTGLIADTLKHGTYGLTIVDSLGCSYRDSIKVNDIVNTRVSFDITKTRCDSFTGKIVATANSSKAPYKYFWKYSPADTFPTLDSLGVGGYELTVIDSFGCIYDTAVLLEYTHYPLIRDSVIDVTCAGNNGEIHIKIDSVISPMTIRWNGVIDSVYKKTGLSAPQFFWITVVDSQKCTGSQMVSLNPYGGSIPLLTASDPPCGRNLGRLEVIGDKIQSVTWNPGGKTTRSIDSLAPGPYFVTVVDSNGCSYILRDTLEYTLPPRMSYTKDRPNCQQADGVIYGSIAYSQSIDHTFSFKKAGGSFSLPQNFNTNFSLNNLLADTYIVLVLDSRGCESYDTIGMPDSAAHKLNFEVTNARCVNNNGRIKAIATGGKAPYKFNWYDISKLDSIRNLESGWYQLTVTDARGCIVTDSAEVKYPLPPVVSLYGDHSLCGYNKGKLYSEVADGVSPIAYRWSGRSDTTNQIVGLNGGTYKLIVTDSLGCKDSSSISIIDQPPLLYTIAKTSANCGFNNASALITILSGVPPYNATWNGNITGLSRNNLDSGRHPIHIIDSNNCERYDTIEILRIPKPTLSASLVNDNCTYKQGRIQAFTTLGKLPYTYAWSHNTSLNSSLATGLGSGNYTVSVTDSLGCMVADVITLSDSAGPTLALMITQASCGLANASVVANVSSNKPPITYYWNNVIGTNTLTGVNGGHYICKVTDARGCIKLDTARLDTIGPLFGQITKRNASCNQNNGTIKLLVTGGTGARLYNWGHSLSNVDSVGGLSPGTYKVTVSDIKGCTWSDSIVITQTGFPTVSLKKYDAQCRMSSGSIKATVTNSSDNLSYIWSNNQTTDSAIQLVPGSYTVTVNDGPSCQVAATAVVANIGMDSIRLQIFHPRCLVNNGRVKAIAVNPRGNVTYQWSTNDAIDSIQGLAASTYTVTVTDSLCSYSKSAQLVMGTIPQLSLSKTDATCGINNGVLNSATTQGTPPMTYKWSNNILSPNVFGVDSGTYTLTVTDSYGCRDSQSIYLARQLGLNTSYTIQKSRCGLDNGSASVVVSGGVPGYDLTWENNTKSNPRLNMLAGNYYLTIKDANNCTRIDTVRIEDRKKPIILDNKLQAVCNKANGAIYINIQDGTAPFRYLWSTGDTTQDLYQLAVGIYRLTVTDSIGCTASKSIDIDPGTPPYLHPDSTRSEQSTCGLKNGKMQALLLRGVAPIRYSWSTGDTGSHVTNIIPGKHYLTVTDGRQCIVYDSLIVTTTTLPQLRLDSTDAYCLLPTGQINSKLINGTPPYQYRWSHGATTPDANNVYSGVYTVTVSDVYNCADTASIRVIEEPNLVSASYDTFRLNCYNDFSGQVILHATGGLAPYQYTVVSSKPDSIFTGLGAGKYHFSVTDVKGCIYQDSFIINQPDSFVLKWDSIKPLTCHNRQDGMLQVSASGSNGGFSYRWLPTNQVGNKATQLGDNTHSVIVRDAKGCTDTLRHVFINPAQIIVKHTITDNLCFGESKGAIKIQTSNGIPPYSYAWSNGDTSDQPLFLANGPYQLTLTDKVGCIVQHEYPINSPPKIIPGIPKAKDLVCEGSPFGEIEIKQFDGGVRPFSFSLDREKNYTLSPKFRNLPEGHYKIYLRDKNGCLDSVNSEIKGYPLFKIQAYPKDTTITLGESVSLGVNVSQGDPLLINAVQWSPPEGLSCTDCYEPVSSTYISRNYRVEVRYSQHCVVWDTVKIKVIDDNDLYIPNTFAPEASNPENRTFRIYANKVIKAELMIFNRWGEKMYETDQGDTLGWDGTWKGEPAPMAVYIYHVRVTYFNGRKIERKGDVTLVR